MIADCSTLGAWCERCGRGTIRGQLHMKQRTHSEALGHGRHPEMYNKSLLFHSKIDSNVLKKSF